MNHFLRYLFIVLSWFAVEAQSQETIKLEIKVKLINKYSKDSISKPETIRWSFFPDYADAESFKDKFEKYAENESYSEELENLKSSVRVYKGTNSTIRWEQARPGGIVLYTYDNYVGIVQIKANGEESQTIIYPLEGINRKEIDGGGQGKFKQKRLPTSDIVEDEFSDSMYVRIKIPLDSADLKSSTRIIVQPYMEECLTEDTVRYCSPLVFDATEYNDLQDKRMDYDFMKNDPLAIGFVRGLSLLVPGKDMEIDTVVVYHKPNRRTDYRVPYELSFEDYHHQYKTESFRGSCLRKRPFKFMDFSVATANFDILENDDDIKEFFEDQLPTYVERNEALDLRFEEKAGSTTLLKDSINDAQFNKLIGLLQEHGSDLMASESSIIAYASAEGSKEANNRVADGRAKVAAALVNSRMPSGKTLKAKTYIYTWEETAQQLESKQYINEAQAIRAILSESSNKIDQDRKIRNISTYDEIIIPILNSQRKMACKYMYASNHIMEAQECVEKYKEDKFFSFSNGDYFKLFSTLTDSVELEELTEIAYQKYTKNDYYEREKFAPYVMNCKAIMDINRATPDTMTLRALIDTTKTINYRYYYNGIEDSESYIILNHEEYLINQSISYFILGRMVMADRLLKMLEENSERIRKTDNRLKLVKLRQFINFRRYHFSDQTNPAYIEGKNYILGTNDEKNINKAILYTEVDEWNMQPQADKYVNEMDDNDPRKWYLKAILSSKNAEKDDVQELQEYMDNDINQTIGNPIDDNMKDDGNLETQKIPFYLGYMQGCFDLEPKFKNYYYSEGHFSDELRKKYKYKLSKKEDYRKLFELLKKRDSSKRTVSTEKSLESPESLPEVHTVTYETEVNTENN